MVVLTKEIAGVIIEDADEVVQETQVFNPDLKLKTRNRFGKPTLERKSPSNSKMPFQRIATREEQDRVRKERGELRDLKQELQADIKVELEEKRLAREEKKRQKEANDQKNLGFQVINDNRKIKKMKRLVRSKIIHMPAEHFERYLQKHRRQFE
jgi:exonuclease VII large subunit